MKFSETKLGRFLLIFAPLEYQMVCDAVEPDKRGRRSAGMVANTVMAISLASDNPVFHSPDFRMALIDYKRFGLYSKSRKKWCVRDAVAASQNRQEQVRLED